LETESKINYEFLNKHSDKSKTVRKDNRGIKPKADIFDPNLNYQTHEF